MKLSLSVRVAESFSDKRKSTMTIDELIAMANKFGYEALCMRASQVGTHSPPEQIAEVRQKVDAAGLRAAATGKIRAAILGTQHSHVRGTVRPSARTPGHRTIGSSIVARPSTRLPPSASKA
jgi:hypothetical protein